MEPCPIAALPSAAAARVRAAVLIPSLARALEELVLNALDADASRVEVLVIPPHARQDLSGWSLEVRDNGQGIKTENFGVLGDFGASSKVTRLGHRGEAVAALRWVSRCLRIDSKAQPGRAGDSAATWRKSFVQGALVHSGPAPCPRGGLGTTVFAEGILEPLPVRCFANRGSRVQDEAAFARRRLERISLMKPAVCFLLRCLGTDFGFELRPVPMVGPSGGIQQRVLDVLGMKLSSLCDLKGSSFADGIELDGVVSLPHEPQSSDRCVFVFVNGRYVEATPVHELVAHVWARWADILAGRQFSVSAGPASMVAVAAGRAWPVLVLNVRCAREDCDMGYSRDRSLVEFRDWMPVLRLVRGTLRRLLVAKGLYETAFEGDLMALALCGRRSNSQDVFHTRGVSRKLAHEQHSIVRVSKLAVHSGDVHQDDGEAKQEASDLRKEVEVEFDDQTLEREDIITGRKRRSPWHPRYEEENESNNEAKGEARQLEVKVHTGIIEQHLRCSPKLDIRTLPLLSARLAPSYQDKHHAAAAKPVPDQKPPSVRSWQQRLADSAAQSMSRDSTPPPRRQQRHLFRA